MPKCSEEPVEPAFHLAGPTTHSVYLGDSRAMEAIGSESVHLVVTSPPYWQIKDYGTIEQIGFGEDLKQYYAGLNEVWAECDRVLHPGCKLCINVGDQFLRTSQYGRYSVVPIREEIIRFCMSMGLDYQGAIIWKKITNTKSSGGSILMGSYPYPRNGIVKIDYEFILLFKKLGNAPKPSEEVKKSSAMTKEQWCDYFTGHWTIPGVRQSGHIAMFPLELPTRLIQMFSFTGETVLDPFMGSGTTALAAKRLGRNSLGYEINPAYIDIIRTKVPEETDIMVSLDFDDQPSELNLPEYVADGFPGDQEHLPER